MIQIKDRAAPGGHILSHGFLFPDWPFFQDPSGGGAAAPAGDLAWHGSRRLGTLWAILRRQALGGIRHMAMRNSGDCLCGLLVYSLHWSLDRGPVLTVPLFTAVDVANSPEAVRALPEAAERQASALHCAAVEIRLDRAQSRLADRLRLLGLSSGADVFGKTIPRQGKAGSLGSPCHSRGRHGTGESWQI